MSDFRAELDLRAILTRIDRDLAEIDRLRAEAPKLERDRWWAPWLPIAAVATAGAGLLAAAVGILKLAGL